MTLHTLQIGMEWFGEHPGGLNRVYAHLVGELARRGVDVSGLVAGTAHVRELSGGLVEGFAPARAPLVVRWRALRRRAAHWIAEQPADGVVACHFALHGLPLLDLVAEQRFIVHFHGPWAAESRLEGHSAFGVAAKWATERLVYGRASRAIVLSNAFGDVLHQKYGVPRERIHVVPGGCDVQRFAPTGSRRDARRALGWPTDRPIVLCVRRLVKRVGLGCLVDAAVELRRRVPDVLILIAGQGAQRLALQERIVARQLDGTVRLVGFIPDELLPLAYRAADLSVVPSVALEGFGLVTAESLASGTPVVVTPVGGLADVVTPLSDSLVAPSSRPSDLARALGDALLGTRSLPGEEQCLRYAREHFTWSVMAARVRDVYTLDA